LQQRPKSITIHASVLASVTLIVTPNQDFDLNIFSTSSVHLSNIRDWSSRYELPAPIVEDTLEPIPWRTRARVTTTNSVTLVESSTEEDEKDGGGGEARRKHPLTLFDGLEKTGATVTETDESYVFGRMHTCSVKQDTSLKIEKMSTIKNKLKVNY
jgi:hypothetical protein